MRVRGSREGGGRRERRQEGEEAGGEAESRAPILILCLSDIFSDMMIVYSLVGKRYL